MSILTLLLSILFEVLATLSRQGKKVIQIGKTYNYNYLQVTEYYVKITLRP